MEDRALELENQENEENGGTMSWIFDKGMALGKGILVTGLVVSSAPVVIPPLVVISALGFACSVPYGILLASYACTEKLMSKLLPSPSAPPHFEEHGQERKYGENDADFGGNIEPQVKGNEQEVYVSEGDLYAPKGLEQDDKDKGEIVEKNEHEEPEQATEKSMDTVEGVSGVMVPIEGDKESATALEVKSVEVEVCMGDGNEDNEELVRKTRGLVEEIRDEGKAEEGAGKDKQTVEEGLKTDRNIEETVSVDRNVQRHVVIETKTIEQKIEENGRKESSVGSAEAEETIAAESEASVTKKHASGKRAKQRKKPNRDKEIAVPSNADIREIAAKPEQSSADCRTPEGSEQSSDITDSSEITIPPRVHEAEGSGIPSENDPGKASNEELYSEENIWKQIDAVRTIVGYTATRHATCIEELKALYVFTGVEPPASFKDSSDMVEVSDKLGFLMSIVGVK